MFSTLLLKPSTYMLFAWLASAGLYYGELVAWNPPGGAFNRVVVVTLLASLAAMALSPPVRVLSEDLRPLYRDIAWVFLAIGVTGHLLHASYIAGLFGGWSGLWRVLTSSADAVRSLENKDFGGTQITYFAWFAAWSWPHLRSRVPSLLILALVLGLSLIYVDRTRVVWVSFGYAMVSLAKGVHVFQRVGTAGRAFALLLAVLAGYAAFMLIALWTGKNWMNNAHVAADVPFYVKDVALYATCGFAYLNEVLSVPHPDIYTPLVWPQLFYPAYRAGTLLFGTPPPPSQVLDFVYAPYATNVGTHLEPFLSCWGEWGMYLAAIACPFFLDFAARVGARTGGMMGRILWVNMCFAGALSSFVPKLVSFPVWICVAAYFLERLLVARSHRILRADA